MTAELALGGMWDIARTPVHDVVEQEWAYPGVVFTDTGAIASHLATGYHVVELAVLIPLLALTVLSWSTRPPARRVR